MGRLEETRGIDLVEVAHQDDAHLRPWLDRLLAALRGLVPSTVVASAAIVRRHADRYELVAGDTASYEGGPLAPTVALLPTIDPTLLDRFYRIPQPLELHGIQTDASAATMVASAFGGERPKDSLAIVAQGHEGVSMVAFALSSEPLALSVREKLLLSRTAAHVEAGLRARVGSAPPSAVLARDGRVLSADGPARRKVVREALSHHVVTVERGRTTSERRRPEALDAWTAMVGGRYAIVEHEQGGRREYHVHENPPHVWAARALTEREARVLELTARGLQGKMVAYHLGISAAAVSSALRSGAEKLGLGSREEAVRIAAEALRPTPDETAAPKLTRSELDVLERLRFGWTNAAIAAARGTSVRTVANQVHQLLQKHGQPSRRALIAAMQRAGEEGVSETSEPGER